MPLTSNLFRVFVSSTFRDWREERDYLQRHVWPVIDDYCLSRKCRFEAIDLRWGISAAASRAAQTMTICLREIERCQRFTPRPNFLLLLGDRYGYRPVPEAIVDSEVNILKDALDEPAWLELFGSGTTPGWYCRDDNALYEQAGTTYAGVWRLQSWVGRLESIEIWFATEAYLREKLLRAAEVVVLPNLARIKYQCSAVHQEFEHAIALAVDNDAHIIACLRSLSDVPNTAAGRDFADWYYSNDQWLPDEAAIAGIRALRERVSTLGGRNLAALHNYNIAWQARESCNYMERFANNVRDSLFEQIDQAIAQQATTVSIDKRRAHDDFMAERRQNIIGRQHELDHIAAYIASDAQQAMVVVGEEGSGKSTLLAEAITQTRNAHCEAEILYRFCGVTPDSINEQSFLHSLYEEIANAYGVAAIDCINYEACVANFYTAIALPEQTRRRLILFIDGLDKLKGTFAWLPMPLPPHVHIVLSCLTTDVEALPAQVKELELAALNMNDRVEIVRRRLLQMSRTLQPQQMAVIVPHTSMTPLYLTLLANIVSQWASYDPPLELPKDMYGLINYAFDNFSNPEKHGSVLVAATMSYLATSRVGLAEFELRQMLTQDDNYWEQFLTQSAHIPVERQLPIAVWSRLLFDLEPYLHELPIEGETVLNFFHRVFTDVVSHRFVPQTEQQYLLHSRMADYFESVRPLENRRRISELPWHLARAQHWSALAELLADEDFLLERIVPDGHDDEAIAYWHEIESNTTLRAKEVYKGVIDAALPASFTSIFVLRLLAELGYDTEALEFLDVLLKQCELQGNVADRRHYLWIKASILECRGDKPEALASLHADERHVKQHYGREGIAKRLHGHGMEEDKHPEWLYKVPEQPDVELAHSLLRQVDVLMSEGNAKEGITLASRAADLYAKGFDQVGEARAFAKLARLYTKQGDKKAALSTLERACDLARDAGVRDLLTDLTNQRAELHYAQRNIGVTVDALEELASLLRPKGNTPNLRMTLGRLAESLSSNGIDPERAMLLLKELRSLCLGANDQDGVERCDMLLAHSEGMVELKVGFELVTAGCGAEASAHLKIAQDLFLRVGNKRMFNKAQELYSSVNDAK